MQDSYHQQYDYDDGYFGELPLLCWCCHCSWYYFIEVFLLVVILMIARNSVETIRITFFANNSTCFRIYVYICSMYDGLKWNHAFRSMVSY